MSRNDNLKLTSVKIHSDLAESFRIESARTGFSLQKLVNRTIHLFINDPQFKENLMSYSSLAPSGSL
jgi:hypothetical protein